MNHQLSYEDQQLILGCEQGDAKSQRALYEKYVQAMYHTIIRFVRDRADAEDVTQETFIKVFSQLNSFRGASTLGGWIKRIAINTALEFLRKQKKIQYTAIEDRLLELPELTEVAAVSISMKRIHEAIKCLPSGCGTILNLFLLEGYQHKEIAQILDISESTSKTQYRRAKLMLQEHLSRYRKEENYE